MTTIETVLFDIDGTLVDSNDAHTHAWIDALTEAGFEVAFERVRPLIGMGSDKLLPELGLGLSKEDEPGKSIVARRKELFLERHIASVKPFAGAAELVRECRARGLHRIVASSSSPEELKPLLEKGGVLDAFDHAVSPEEVQATKPDPDIIKAALAWSGTEPARAVMIGDTSYDVEAAGRAGVRIVALRCGGSSDEALQGAAAIFDDPAALAAALRASGFDDILAQRERAGRAG